MARKQILTNTNTLEGWSGPYVDGNDNVYVMVHAPSGGDPRVWKAGSDPLADAWSQQDAANNPTTTHSGNAFASWQEGDEIHLVGWDSVNRYEYSVFRTSDHASADTWGTVDEEVENPAQDPGTPACYIAVRSNGDRIVLYNGDTDKVMGTNYDRCDYSINTGAGWSAPVNVGGDGIENDATAVGIGRGVSNTIWFDYFSGSGDEYNDLPTSDTLGTAVTNTLGSSGFRSPLIGYYDDGGVEVMTTAVTTGAAGQDSQQLRNGTVQTELDLSGTDFSSEAPCIAIDGTDAYVVYRSGTADDVLYQKSADGAAWGDITTISTATAPILISANVIDHGGGSVIAVVYRDTHLYYDEISIAAAAASDSPNRQNARFNHLLRR